MSQRGSLSYHNQHAVHREVLSSVFVLLSIKSSKFRVRVLLLVLLARYHHQHACVTESIYVCVRACVCVCSAFMYTHAYKHAYKHTNGGAAHEDDGGYDTSLLISDFPLEFDEAHACTKHITRLHYDLLDDELPVDGVAPVVERLLTANSTLYLCIPMSGCLRCVLSLFCLCLCLSPSIPPSLSRRARAF